jgi:hypothetical protein
MLFSDGSLIVAVANWELSPAEATYVAGPACAPLALLPVAPLPTAPPLGVPAFVAEWHPLVISETAKIIVIAGRIPRIVSIFFSFSSFRIAACFISRSALLRA